MAVENFELQICWVNLFIYFLWLSAWAWLIYFILIWSRIGVGQEYVCILFSTLKHFCLLVCRSVECYLKKCLVQLGHEGIPDNVSVKTELVKSRQCAIMRHECHFNSVQWKLIQRNIFIRWTNKYLKTVNKWVTDLQMNLFENLILMWLKKKLCFYV